jgi:hypothetical protein
VPIITRMGFDTEERDRLLERAVDLFRYECLSEAAMIRGEEITVAREVTAIEAFDFVLDPAQYTKADTKIVWVTKLADTPNGMLAREDGKFLGRFKDR